MFNMKVGDFFSELTAVQKRAFFKLVVDIVKVDGLIHCKEVALLNELQTLCEITSVDLDLIHYISLQKATSALRLLPLATRKRLLEVLESVVGVDNDIDKRENMLLTAITMALSSESDGWSHIISTTATDATYSNEQIVYLEREWCEATHDILDDDHDRLLLTKALKDAGLTLFYLPSVISELNPQNEGGVTTASKLSLLQRSMEFLVPTGDKSKLLNLGTILGSLDTAIFYKVVLSSYGILPSEIPYSSFFLLKVQESDVLDDDDRITKTVDFLCIDVSCDLKKRLLHLVNIIEKPVNALSYDGYYKVLYDYLSSESSIMSSIHVDSEFEFYLKDLGDEKLEFESAPQAKALYLLLMRYGVTGVSQECFTKALDFLENCDIATTSYNIIDFKKMLLDDGSEHAKLIYNLLVVYDTISTKDVSKAKFIGYLYKIIHYRSSLKNYINKGFLAVPHLAGKEKYCICFDLISKCYRVPIGHSMFFVEQNSGNFVSFAKSDLWRKMIL